MFRNDGREVWTVGIIRGNDLFTIYVATDNGEIVYVNHRNPPATPNLGPDPQREVSPSFAITLDGTVYDLSDPDQAEAFRQRNAPSSIPPINDSLPAPPCVSGFGTYYSLPPAQPPNAVAVDD